MFAISKTMKIELEKFIKL